MTTQSFTAKNCITQIITLKKECHNCKVTSPFGIIANSSNDEFATHNDLTIVWTKPDANQEPECDYKNIWTGTGNLTNGKTQSKLEDSNSQLEMIFNNTMQTLCTNETAYPVLGVPETYITISNRSSRRKRETDDYPAGVIRLANATLYCISYPQNPYDFQVLPCATADNMATDDESITTNEMGQYMIFLPNGNIMVEKEQYCMHTWGLEGIAIAVNQCSQNDEDITFTADTWILTEKFQNQQLTPLKIIQKHSNLCLTATPNSPLYHLWLSNCSDSADQYFIIDRTFQMSKQLLYATAPKITENNQTDISLSDQSHIEQPFNRFHEAVPQFHGTIISQTVPGYCLTLPTTKTLTFGICKNETLTLYPIQNFAYHDGFLTIRETASCVTPFRIDNCTSSDKWTYDPHSKTLKWEERCLSIEERNSARFLHYSPCTSSTNNTTKWNFQYILKNDPLPQQVIPKIKSLNQRRFRAKHTKPENQKQNKNNQQQQDRPIDPQQKSSNQKEYLDNTDTDREILAIENRQFLEAQSVAHETKLANEIRQMYCKITTIQRNQALLLAQSNGLLAAQALKLKKCSRVSGSGSTLTLQQCAIVPIQLTATLTACGYQPFFQGLSTNYTIGKDGWSLHPFQECFWTSEYVSLNGQTYRWINNEWKVEEPTIHLTKLSLINKFEDIPLKSYEYLPHHRSIYDSNTMEQTNVLADLISRIQLSSTNSLSSLVLDKKSSSNFLDASNWTNIFKYGLLGLITFITLIILLYFTIICIPFNKLFSSCKHKKRLSPTDIKLTTPLRRQNTHSHPYHYRPN